jgi:hypothetical protein
MKKKRSEPERIPPADYKNEAVSFFLTPMLHPIVFSIIFVPVIVSVVAASIIHEFTFLYLLIPGFWCYAVGCFIINGINDGTMTDNSGTATRRKNPFRFWVKIFIWSLGYIFATISPLGLAFQESEQSAKSTTINI